MTDGPLRKDEIAAAYDLIAEQIYESKSMYLDTLRLAPDCTGAVIDIGCGQGRFLELLRDRCASVTNLAGCDISPRMCELAAERVPEAVVRVCDAEVLEIYEDESFDAAFMIATLEHLQDHAAGVAAARRILRPGGILTVSVPNRNWIRYRRWAELHTPVQPVDDYWFAPDELRALLEGSGLVVEEVKGVWALLRSDWRHNLEKAAAVVFPSLNYKMKAIGMRARKPSA